jgi:hypothetical protein
MATSALYLVLVFRHSSAARSGIWIHSAREVVATLQRLTTQYGSRFAPCEQLLQMAAHSERFWNIGETDLNS